MTRKVDIKDMLKNISAFNMQFSQIKKQVLSKQNLNASTVNLISIIADETMTLKEITEISELDKSTISRQMNVLVNSKLVTRSVGEDKRFSYFQLTEEAKVIYRQYTKDFIEYVDHSLNGWSEEEKHMFLVLIGRATYSFSSN